MSMLAGMILLGQLTLAPAEVVEPVVVLVGQTKTFAASSWGENTVLCGCRFMSSRRTVGNCASPTRDGICSRR